VGGIGDLLARRRAELRLSQSELASALAIASGRTTVTRHEVSRWERGDVVPGRFWQQHLAQVLGIAPAELRLAAARSADPPSPAAGWLRIAHEWLVLDPPQVVQRRAGRRIGAGLLDQLEHRVAELRRLDDHLAGGDTYELVTGELDVTVELAADSAYSQQVGRRLLGVIGELGQLAGWVAYDAGRHDAAARHYLTGADAARAAGRPEIAANNLSSLAYQLANTGNPHDAALLAATAVQGTAGEHPAVRALMLDRLAWAQARAGDSDATAHALDTATGLLADAPDPPEWLYWLDTAEAEIMAGRCWTELHRPLRAVPLLEAACARLPADHTRELALYLSWLVMAYADAREPERAAAVGVRVLQLSRDTTSSRAAGRLAAVLHRLAEHRNVPAVAELLTAGASLPT
jgi:transcriptional regulator with XRE-family HTH domain